MPKRQTNPEEGELTSSARRVKEADYAGKPRPNRNNDYDPLEVNMLAKRRACAMMNLIIEEDLPVYTPPETVSWHYVVRACEDCLHLYSGLSHCSPPL